MYKKTDINELDIPKDDIECWVRYPKHHWVYDMSRLLDAQNVKWSPYSVPSLPDREINIRLKSELHTVRQPGIIYVKISDGPTHVTEVYIVKGEIKHMHHIDEKTGNLSSSLEGEVELRISAFVSLHFTKFTGIISCTTHGADIFSICLRPMSDLSAVTDQELVRLIKRIYKKSDLTLSGLADQALLESIAS